MAHVLSALPLALVRALRPGAAPRHAGRRLRALLPVLALPLALRAVVLVGALVALWAAANWLYQVVRKPTELLFPLSGVLSKAPAQTWQQYAPLFRRHATAVMTPELLAALAQVEGAGNPAARTYWRWAASWNPLEVYRPASSAVGMYQITDATFREARRYCVRDHVAVEDDCWFTRLYTRLLPSHAVEMTAGRLDRSVARTLERQRVARATLLQQQDLAAVIHLCGARAGEHYARRGFRAAPGQRCGDHDLTRYLARVNAMKRHFARLAAG
jgi:hypothetical protein